MQLFRRGDVFSLIAIGVVLGMLLVFKYFPFPETTSSLYRIVIESEEGEREIAVTPQSRENLTVRGPLGETTIAIQGGKVWVVFSPCPDKTCIKMGKIPDNGGFIACVPNRVTIRVVKEEPKTSPVPRQ